jgi:hypothetical protein
MNRAHQPKKAKTFKYCTISPTAGKNGNFLVSLLKPALEN